MQTQPDPLDPENMLGYIAALADALARAWPLGCALAPVPFAGI